MADKTTRFSDTVAVVGAIDPDANAAAAYSSDWISMVTWGQIAAIIQAGTLGSSATLDGKLEQATDGSGTGVKDITGKAITQLTQAGTDSDKQAVIECVSSELDVDNDFTHVRLTITVAVATSDVSAVVLATRARHGKASDQDASTVDEIVA